MAKIYDFRITVRKAEETSDGRSFAVVFGGSDTVYSNTLYRGTLQGAIAESTRLHSLEARASVVYFGMANSLDRKPPGFNKLKGSTFKPAGSTK